MKIHMDTKWKALRQAETFRLNGVVYRKPLKGFHKKLISGPLGWISITIQVVVRQAQTNLVLSEMEKEGVIEILKISTKTRCKGSSHCGAAKAIRLGTMRFQVQSLASLTELRIWHYCELQRRSQRQLRSCIAVSVVQASSCNSHSTPKNLGTSICHWCSTKKKKKKKKKDAREFLLWHSGLRIQQLWHQVTAEVQVQSPGPTQWIKRSSIAAAVAQVAAMAWIQPWLGYHVTQGRP